jgi:hypothetical protein
LATNVNSRGRASERPRRSTGELYDAIWTAELPAIMDERDERAPAVADSVARLILMAMAKHTNPTRDQVLGPAREWQCFASVATLAELAGASERQAQRVLRVFEREGLIERLEQGRRPGRPRKGEVPGQARPSTWCLRPDRWPARTLKNRTGIVAISSDSRNSLPVPVEVPSVPAQFSENSTGTGPGRPEILPVVSPELFNRLTPRDDEPGTEPARAAARAGIFPGVSAPGFESEAATTSEPRQVALPLTSAVGLPVHAPVATGDTSLDAALDAGRRLWRAVRDPLLRPDVGLASAVVARLRNTGTSSYDPSHGHLVLEGALLPQDLEDPLITQALAVAAGGQLITVHLAGSRNAEPGAPPDVAPPHPVDGQVGATDTRSAVERWAADRAYLVSRGVPEERLRRMEYDMLGAGHCQVCQTLAFEDPLPQAVNSQ